MRSGVVDGHFFEVMGLRPALGRLIGPDDDGAKAAGVVVLTHRFWTNTLGADPAVLGKSVRLGAQTAEVIGVLEPSAPYPEETEIIANVVTSPHHLSATMVTEREHRMTEVFGRMAPGADLAAVRAELQVAYSGMTRELSSIYTPRAHFQISVVPLREQLTARARTILLVLLGASGLIFIIACANVVNLVLARTVRRESELAVRAAILPNTMAVRRTLLAESLLLCGLGALAGVLIAQPMVTLARAFHGTLFRPRPRFPAGLDAAVARRRARADCRGAAGIRAEPAGGRPGEPPLDRHLEPSPAGLRYRADRRVVSDAGGCGDRGPDAAGARAHQPRFSDAEHSGDQPAAGRPWPVRRRRRGRSSVMCVSD